MTPTEEASRSCERERRKGGFSSSSVVAIAQRLAGNATTPSHAPQTAPPLTDRRATRTANTPSPEQACHSELASTGGAERGARRIGVLDCQTTDGAQLSEWKQRAPSWKRSLRTGPALAAQDSRLGRQAGWALAHGRRTGQVASAGVQRMPHPPHLTLAARHERTQRRGAPLHCGRGGRTQARPGAPRRSVQAQLVHKSPSVRQSLSPAGTNLRRGRPALAPQSEICVGASVPAVVAVSWCGWRSRLRVCVALG